MKIKNIIEKISIDCLCKVLNCRLRDISAQVVISTSAII